MPSLRYNIAATLDGYIASADHTTQWITEDPTIDFPALYAQFSTFVMGRKTYETMLAFGDQNPLKGYPRENVVVVSRTLVDENVTVVRNDVVGYVKALKENRVTKDIWLMGGAGLAGLLMREGLVNVVEVAVMPVVIGEGIKMLDFEGDSRDGKGWKL
ncbi:riboflavin biosynthesis protein RibD C-terminal domain-containing protein, partial [Marasmius fiardii PR-910]